MKNRYGPLYDSLIKIYQDPKLIEEKDNVWQNMIFQGLKRNYSLTSPREVSLQDLHEAFQKLIQESFAIYGNNYHHEIKQLIDLSGPALASLMLYSPSFLFDYSQEKDKFQELNQRFGIVHFPRYYGVNLNDDSKKSKILSVGCDFDYNGAYLNIQRPLKKLGKVSNLRAIDIRSNQEIIKHLEEFGPVDTLLLHAHGCSKSNMYWDMSGWFYNDEFCDDRISPKNIEILSKILSYITPYGNLILNSCNSGLGLGQACHSINSKINVWDTEGLADKLDIKLKKGEIKNVSLNRLDETNCHPAL